MGDRTSVTLTVLTSQKAEAEKIFMADGYEADHMTDDDHIGLSHFSFYEVNYGDLPCLSDLTAAGIAHDSCWDHGGDYSAGTEFMRFTSQGEAKGYSYSNDDYNPDLKRLVALVNEPQALIAYILDHEDKVNPLPWDHQEEFGKIYRTKQLLT